MQITATNTATPLTTLLGSTQLAQLEKVGYEESEGKTKYNIKLRVVTGSQSIYIENGATATTNSLNILVADGLVDLEVRDISQISVLGSAASVVVSIFIS